MGNYPFAAAAAAAAAWQSNLLAPAGALAETFPRINAQSNDLFSSGSSVIGAIPLPAGIKVSNITVVTGNTAETGGSHGWVALTDSTGKVLAASADQGATWLSPGNSFITTALATPYTVTAAGVYYIVLGLTATGPPQLLVFSGGGVAGAIEQAPVLGGNAGASAGPPAAGTTLTLNFTTNSLYAYVS